MVTFDSPTPRMSHDAFAQKLMQKLRDAGDQRQARYDKVEFRLLFYREGRSIGYANLRNLYQEYCSRSLVDRSHFFQHATRSLLASHKTLPVDFPDAKSDVLLSVRNRSYFSLIELQNQLNGKGELSWPYLPLAEHLGVGLVYDLPEAMLMLQQSHLDDWGVSFYEAYEAAYLNLSESQAAFATLEERTYMSTTGDNYDASRLLVPELIEALKVDGHPVVMIPNRDRPKGRTGGTSGLHRTAQEVTPLHREVRIRATETSHFGAAPKTQVCSARPKVGETGNLCAQQYQVGQR